MPIELRTLPVAHGNVYAESDAEEFPVDTTCQCTGETKHPPARCFTTTTTTSVRVLPNATLRIGLSNMSPSVCPLAGYS